MTTIAHRERLERVASARIDRVLNSEQSLELALSREAASPIIQSLETGKESMHIMNLPNRGQTANLPAEAVEETMVVVGANGAEGIAIGDLPTGVASVVRRIIDVQELIVEAGPTRDRAPALQAMRLDHMVSDWNATDAMLGELLETNRDWLPQFFD